MYDYKFEESDLLEGEEICYKSVQYLDELSVHVQVCTTLGIFTVVTVVMLVALICIL